MCAEVNFDLKRWKATGFHWDDTLFEVRAMRCYHTTIPDEMVIKFSKIRKLFTIASEISGTSQDVTA